jgi:hypothetical protein
MEDTNKKDAKARNEPTIQVDKIDYVRRNYVRGSPQCLGFKFVA